MQTQLKVALTTVIGVSWGLLIFYLALWIGQQLAPLMGGFLPASIIGMLLLVAALSLRIIPLSWVESCANLFVRWMALLFVPIGVALVEQLDVLLDALPALLATCVFATLVLLGVVGHFYQWLVKPE
jgi:holin-like protein